ncbi:MAG: hypothetical protein AB7N71_08325 [Phycisphaerae bacterium]
MIGNFFWALLITPVAVAGGFTLQCNGSIDPAAFVEATPAQPEPATAPPAASVGSVPSRAELIAAAIAGLDGLWANRVEFVVAERSSPLVGFAQFATIDDKRKFWGNEAGQACREPTWCFQAREGLAGSLLTFLQGHASLRREIDLDRARAIGDTLLWVQEQIGGGWFQDSIVRDGQLRNVQVWGEFEPHPLDEYQNLIVCDDGTSQSCAMALIYLYEATKEKKYLDGAIRFGELILNIATQPEFADGGLPQLYPFVRAAKAPLNQGMDPRNPDGPYHVQKTLNDRCQTDQMIVLHELYRVTNDSRWLDALKLQVRWLLKVRPTDGGWAHQYDYKTDKPCWGRHKEPPAYSACEHAVVETLLWLRLKVNDAELRIAMENEITEYVRWLSTLPQCAPDRLHRYYSEEKQPIWANDYKIVATLEEAGGGQPYCGKWDLRWVSLMGTRQRPDFSAWTKRVGDLAVGLIDVRPVSRQKLRELIERQVDGALAKTRKIAGEERVLIENATHCGFLMGLFREIGVHRG